MRSFDANKHPYFLSNTELNTNEFSYGPSEILSARNGSLQAFSGRYIDIESTPLDLTGGMFSKYDPVTGIMKKREIPHDDLKVLFLC